MNIPAFLKEVFEIVNVAEEKREYLFQKALATMALRQLVAAELPQKKLKEIHDLASFEQFMQEVLKKSASTTEGQKQLTEYIKELLSVIAPNATETQRIKISALLDRLKTEAA